jgi:pimeloyl-ACP methyl ester carboxylesterase
MLMWGRDDRVTPIDRLDKAVALLNPRQCHVLECGHMAPFERPDVVADHVAAFVATASSRSSS